MSLTDLAWLENWRPQFDVAEIMDLARWEKFRGGVRQPSTIFTAVDIDAARGNVHRSAWGEDALAHLLGRIAAAGVVDTHWAERYISATTPFAPHFTMCPRCEFAPMHGAYDWEPVAPEQIRCKGCGTVYPNADYPEDLVFRSRFDPSQTITFYAGRSWPAYGYAAIHSSFSGHARIHACRYAANLAEDLALAYALTGERRHAVAAAVILKRFADVHPRYLVHSAYGDIADMDPKIAAISLTNLPANEWCPPGNLPDRKLYPGYWMAMRWGSSAGMEGASLQKLILAYDLVAETLSDAECCHIERDLLLDAAPLLFADATINNKTGMNRGAVALIGIVCRDPLLVRFGVDGFVRAVRDWWLPDGGTPESNGYASMMLHGIWAVAEALKHYHDPVEVDLSPRFDGVDLYRWPRYRAVWQGMVRPLTPSLDYPLLADNRLPCHLSLMLAEVLVRNYPSPEHRTLRNAIAEIPRCYAGRIAQFWYAGHLDAISAFYRRPEDSEESGDTLPTFVDDLGPSLKIGTLRGADSMLALSANDWKGHHQRDHLNLFYWKDGRELLTDLGYLWDMEAEMPKVRRSLAHQLVLVNGEDQKSVGRHADFHIFSARGSIKVMEASSDVYAAAPIYRRTVALIGHGAQEIVIDIFRVAGSGSETHDWVMHGPANPVAVSGINLSSTDETIYDLSAVQTAQPQRAWTASWFADSGTPFRLHVPAVDGERLYVGQGFGQRKARDHGATVPYLVRRRGGPSIFVTVYSTGDFVESVTLPHLDLEALNVVVAVRTAAGTCWAASAGPARQPIYAEDILSSDGVFACVSPHETLLIGGRSLRCGDVHLAQPVGDVSGPVYETFCTEHESGFVTSGDLCTLTSLIGSHLHVDPDTGRGGWYPVLAVEERQGQPVLFTRCGDRGYDIHSGSSWRALAEVQ
ncbi:hypothetical protein GC175_16555 [bacterium]|nr:hypothetical protein [bacterium]